MEVKFAGLTYNVKGLRQKVKRIKVFNYVKEKLKSGFIFMQETHSIQNDLVEWQNEWGSKMILNHGCGNSRGTLIAFSSDFDCKILKNISDDEGRLQLCSIEHNGKKLLLVNIYNENTESKQVLLLKKLNTLMECFSDILEHEIIMGGDWNFIRNKKLDADGGNPSLKLSSIAELTKIIEVYELCDIFRVRFPEKRRFSFRQPNPRRLRRLDYFLISNSLQESVKKTEILTSLSSDHSPVYLDFDESPDSARGSTYWKFNSLLLKNPDFCPKLIEEIERLKSEYEQLDPQTKWEIMKYKIRCFCIKFAKTIAREKRKKLEDLEMKIKQFENCPLDSISSEIYSANKLEFEALMEEKTKGYILRSKINWYENGEKSSKFFLNLEKRKAIQNTIKVLVNDANSESENTVKSNKEITSAIKDFYSNLYKRKSTKTINECKQFLQQIQLPALSDIQNEILKKPLTKRELEISLKNSQNGKSPGNDGLTREFYVVFWRNISDCLYQSLVDGKAKGFLSPSQRQAIIKLLEKRGKDKRFIQNWRPISLINYDAKLLSKAMAERLKQVLPFLISHDQTAYVANRFLGESVRLISDILEITEKLNIEGFLLTMDIEKAFDSVDHPFLFAVLEQMNIAPEFIDWIKVLTNKNESCVFNGGMSTGYFPLTRGSRQGDPISTYLFICNGSLFHNG